MARRARGETKRRIIDFVQSNIERTGYMPNRVEIAQHCEVSPAAIAYHTRLLKKAREIPDAPKRKHHQSKEQKAREKLLWRTILLFIDEYVNCHGFSPRMREVATHVDRSLSNTHKHLLLLKSEGLLTFEPTLARTLIVANDWRERLG
jgi:SOS-response transcriptional repressor LexA